MEMKEDYDSLASPVDVNASASPLFSPYTLQATENALRKYTEIAGQGGWPRVSGTERLQLGDRKDGEVRTRLSIEGHVRDGTEKSPGGA